MRVIYTILIFFYWIGIRVAALFHPKAKEWVKGRKTQNKGIIPFDEKKSIWVHCASLGEFEQARPLIESIRNEYPGERIVLSFFSPSGYTVRKDYTKVDQVFYLPIDLPGQISSFIKRVNPKLVIFVKYEFWYNCLYFLIKNKIPYIFIAATFRSKQYFLNPFLSWFKKLIKKAEHIFVQDKNSLQLLTEKGFYSVSCVGDPRIDRVITMSQEIRPIESLEKLSDGSKVFVCGSIHRSDYNHIKEILKEWNEDHKLILVPHDIDMSFIRQMQDDFRDNILYSEIDSRAEVNEKCMIIDKVGILSSIYPYADIVYIGGGFGRGIHNILEAVVFEKAVIIGPNYSAFPEANDLVNNGGIRVIHNDIELKFLLEQFLASEVQFISKESIHQFLTKNKGASQKIIQWLVKNEFLSPSFDN